eukprot:Colp12_sorted_trinity150504_noHs@19068
MAESGVPLCQNNCGFFGNPQTENYCSVCYKKILAKRVTSEVKPPVTAGSATSEPPKSPLKPEQTNKGRCWTCKAKVPLVQQETNRCKCGYVFCDKHKFAEHHSCEFDYRADGRQLISEKNPVIVGDKIQKI